MRSGRSLRRDREEDLVARSWELYGRPSQEVLGEPAAGYETPGRLLDSMKRDGRDKFAPVRVPRDEALADDAPPRLKARAVGALRRAVGWESKARDKRDSRVAVAAAPALRERALRRIEILQRRLERLTVVTLPALRKALVDASFELDKLVFRYRGLSRSKQGYIESVWALVAVELAVVGFDVAVIHAALLRSGMDDYSVWMTTVLVPAAIWACNRAFGWVAGALALKLEGERPRMAVLALVSGGVALATSFALLMRFRHESVESQNDSLRALAEGRAGDQLDFILSPLWFGPLQIAGSIAAVMAVALWTIGRAGRDQRRVIDDWERRIAEGEAALGRGEAYLELTYEELERAELEPFEIDARAATAEVDIATVDEVGDSLDAQEDALARIGEAVYEIEFITTDREFANGGVARCALPTGARVWGSPRTPPPAVKTVPGDPFDAAR